MCARGAQELPIRRGAQGRTIYEWEQTLEDVNIYISPPPGASAQGASSACCPLRFSFAGRASLCLVAGVKAAMISCKIEASGMTLGLKGNPPFLTEKFEGKVNSDDSYWTMGAPTRFE